MTLDEVVRKLESEVAASAPAVPAWLSAVTDLAKHVARIDDDRQAGMVGRVRVRLTASLERVGLQVQDVSIDALLEFVDAVCSQPRHAAVADETTEVARLRAELDATRQERDAASSTAVASRMQLELVSYVLGLQGCTDLDRVAKAVEDLSADHDSATARVHGLQSELADVAEVVGARYGESAVEAARRVRAAASGRGLLRSLLRRVAPPAALL